MTHLRFGSLTKTFDYIVLLWTAITEQGTLPGGKKGGGKRKFWNGPPGKRRGRWVDPPQGGTTKSHPTMVSLGVEMLEFAVGGKKLGRPMVSNGRTNYSCQDGVCKLSIQ